MRSRPSKFVGAAVAFAMCATPAMAAAPTAIQPVDPLVVVSVFGTQAAAQAVCSQAATAAAASAQGAPGCVLPATDMPPPLPGQSAAPPPAPLAGNFGINWLLLGLGSLALLAGIYTLFDDDDDEGAPISPF